MCVPLPRRVFLGVPAIGVIGFLLGVHRLERRRIVEAANSRTLVPLAGRNASLAAGTPVTGSSPTASPTTGTSSPVEAGRFTGTVTTRKDDRYLYVESNGMPTHQMMVGIKSWQQQVPVPQPYAGANAFQVPLNPKLSDTPISAKTGLFNGAIAIAVNGVPIFNALNNRGDDAYLFGELDNWNGHSGKADDYHYHAAPLHLQDVVGAGNPIAFALDGFAIYGLTESNGAAVSGLDQYNGHSDATLGYHYHATLSYPYINGGLRGVVQVQDDHVTPQPTTKPFRPDGTPLSGARITDFSATGPAYSLFYEVNGQTYRVNYRVESNSVAFEFVDPSGRTTTQTYSRAAR